MLAHCLASLAFRFASFFASLASLAGVISAGSSQADKTKALKEIEKIAKAIVDLEDYERDVLYPLATEQLAIDLDDGVKVNYLKFGSALKKIPGLEAKED